MHVHVLYLQASSIMKLFIVCAVIAIASASAVQSEQTEHVKQQLMRLRQTQKKIGSASVATEATLEGKKCEKKEKCKEGKVLCTTYGPDDDRLEDYSLSEGHDWKYDLVEKYKHGHKDCCTPQPNAPKIPADGGERLVSGNYYTVCYTGRDGDCNPSYCVVLMAGVLVNNPNIPGQMDCMGLCGAACDSQSSSGDTHENGAGITVVDPTFGRGACFEHDLCSIHTNASNFVFDDICGDEAFDSVADLTGITPIEHLDFGGF